MRGGQPVLQTPSSPLYPTSALVYSRLLPESSMIQVRNLVKQFAGTEALAGVSFDLAPGEAVGYLGPNGAGKSTTVKILVGLLAPTRGQVTIAGHDIQTNPIEAKRRLGYVPFAIIPSCP